MTEHLNTAELRFEQGRPQLVHNGNALPPATYCDYILRGNWTERNRDFVESGVTIYHLNIAHGTEGAGNDFFDSAFWLDDDVYPESDDGYTYTLDRQARDILDMCPDARFFVKVMLSPPLRWTEKYPGEMWTDEQGKTYREASWASRRYLDDVDRYLRHVVRYCEGRPWGEKILGYLPLPYGEGCSPLTIAGNFFDQSQASASAFRAWLQNTYGSDAELQAAWADNSASLDTAAVPRDSEWAARRERGEASLGGIPISARPLATNAQRRPDGLFHWTETINAARERDYCRFIRDAFQNWAETVAKAVKSTARELGTERLCMMDITKQPLLGWPILSSFDGVGDGQSFPNILLMSGSWDIGPFLDNTELDGLWTPADYTARPLGFAFEAEGLTDSLYLRGKVMVLEDDSRTYVGAGIHDQGAFRTDQEAEAGLLRNSALPISRGFLNYWCNVGSSYFHAPGIQKTVRKAAKVLNRFSNIPHRETRDAVAMIIDDASCLCEDFTAGYQALSVIWQRVKGLAHCGVPYRIYLLSDLEKDNFPDYRTYVFPNLFRVDDDIMELLRQKVLRNGNVALFGPATGITDGHHLTSAPASRLLGLDMELIPRTTVRHVIVQDHGHPITAELPAGFVYGDTQAYGPMLAPNEHAVEAAGGIPLGHANVCWQVNRTGLLLMEHGRGAAGNAVPGARGQDDYAAIWSIAMPLPPELLRACCRFAGSNIWCEQNDVVYASDSMVALHSVKAGPRTIQLPRQCRVRDAVTGKMVAGGRTTQAIRLRIQPPQTRIFELSE